MNSSGIQTPARHNSATGAPYCNLGRNLQWWRISHFRYTAPSNMARFPPRVQITLGYLSSSSVLYKYCYLRMHDPARSRPPTSCCGQRNTECTRPHARSSWKLSADIRLLFSFSILQGAYPVAPPCSILGAESLNRCSARTVATERPNLLRKEAVTYQTRTSIAFRSVRPRDLYHG